MGRRKWPDNEKKLITLELLKGSKSVHCDCHTTSTGNHFQVGWHQNVSQINATINATIIIVVMDLPHNDSQSFCAFLPKSHGTAVDGRTAVHSCHTDHPPDHDQSASYCESTADHVDFHNLHPPYFHKAELVGRVWEVGECSRLVTFYPDDHERKLVGRVWEVGEWRSPE